MAKLLGFRPLPVFNAVSGNHMTRHTVGQPPQVYYIIVDITHTVADVEPVLRRMFSNPRVTVVRPIPEDPSLSIRAVTNERQGLSVYLPLPQVASEASAPEASLPRGVPYPPRRVPEARPRLPPQPYPS